MIELRNRFLLPTPAAAFYVVAEHDEGQLRHFLRMLMAHAASEPADLALLQRWADLGTEAETQRFVEQLLERGWLSLQDQPMQTVTGPLDVALERLLPPLSSEGKVLLADTQGFSVFNHGFSSDLVEDLAALSADLANLQERRAWILRRTQGISGGAWAVINPSGHSRVGFWPLHVGRERFVLVMAGQPLFDQPTLVDFVVLLHRRLAVM